MLVLVRVGLAALFTALACSAQAGQVAKLAEEAEALIAKGDGPAAYDKMRQSLAAAADGIPFDVRKAFFVKQKPMMFGSYDRVASNEFSTGSTLITYAEPIGLAWVPDGSGVRSAFTVDFELRNPAGELLAEQKAFGNFKIESREPIFEIYTPLTLDVSAVPAGDYVLKYVFNDTNSKKTSSVEQRFKLK